MGEKHEFQDSQGTALDEVAFSLRTREQQETAMQRAKRMGVRMWGFYSQKDQYAQSLAKEDFNIFAKQRKSLSVSIKTEQLEQSGMILGKQPWSQIMRPHRT